MSLMRHPPGPRAVDMTGREAGDFLIIASAGTGGSGMGRLWLCECRECGFRLTRPGVTLRKTLDLGHRPRCPECRARRKRQKGASIHNYRERLAEMSEEERARVVQLMKGRTEPVVVAEAVDMVLRNLDDFAAETPPADPFKCDYRSQYSEPL